MAELIFKWSNVMGFSFFMGIGLVYIHYVGLQVLDVAIPVLANQPGAGTIYNQA